MKHLWRAFLLVGLLIAIVGCTPEESGTPTPFTISSTSTPNIGAADPLDIDLAQLVQNPLAYEGARLQINGRFQKLPLLVCEGETFRAPAGWRLSDGSLLALMGGFNSQVRSLIPEETEMTVIGVWRRWEGLIGCGKSANPTSIWYLDVREVVSPSPLAAITQTAVPAGSTSIASNMTPDPNQDPDAGEGTEMPDGETAVTATATPTPIIVGPGSPNPSPTTFADAPTITPRPGSSDDDDEEDQTPEATVPGGTSTAATQTPTATSTNTANNPPPGGTAAPTSPALATATPGNSLVLQDELQATLLEFGNFNSNETHEWLIDLQETDQPIIQVGAVPGVDIILTLVDPDGQIVVNAQNDSAAGEIERIDSFTASDDGFHQLLVSTVNNVPGEYVVNFYVDEFDFPTVLYGILDSDGTENGETQLDGDDFWIFYGQANNTVNITVTPGDSDSTFELAIIANDNSIVEGASEDDLGDPIVLNNVRLPRTGLYALQIFEFDFLDMPYTLQFQIN